MEVDAKKSKDIFVSHEQNAGKYHKEKTYNKSLESVEQIGYLETTLTVHNCNSEGSAIWIRQVLAIIRCGIFHLLGFSPKIHRLNYV